MCEWPDNPERCPVKCIKKYLEKRNPNCPALWQKPRNYSTGKFKESDAMWYCNVPLGKNTLDYLLGRMSKKAGLSTHFTSHCIRATSVTILKAAGLENSRVRSVASHKSDASIESYNERPTIQKQMQSSAIVSNFVAPVKANRSESPLSQEVLLEHCSKTRVERIFFYQSTIQCRRTENQRGPEFFIGYFLKLYFQFLWTVFK